MPSTCKTGALNAPPERLMWEPRQMDLSDCLLALGRLLVSIRMLSALLMSGIVATVFMALASCTQPAEVVEVPTTVEVPVEITREVPVTVEVDREVIVTREVPATVEIERPVITEVEVPVVVEVPVTVEIEREVTREVEAMREVKVAVTREVYVTREVPVTVEVEATREVEVEVTREIEVPVTVEVASTVEVLVEVTREIEVVREVPATVEVIREVDVVVTRVVRETADTTWTRYNNALLDWDADDDGLITLGEVCDVFAETELTPEAHIFIFLVRDDISENDDDSDLHHLIRDWTNRELCDWLN